MGITPTELLAYSEELLEGTEEIHFRAAAGRAFYACCHKCLPLVNEINPIELANEGKHARIIRILGSYRREDQKDSLGKKVREVATKYDMARSIRTKADYYIDKPFLKSKAEKILDIAKEIWEIFDDLKKDFPHVT